MTNLAVIPARGGSKRIPGKNILSFHGKPIIAYSIEAAINSKLFDEVIVSTDSEEIAHVSKSFGASVPFFRSEKAADDFAPLVDVMLEVVGEVEKSGRQYDSICCILPTAPFVTIENLLLAYNKMNDGNFFSVLPIVEFSYPIQRSLIMNNDETLRFSDPDQRSTRSQDLIKHYHDCGQFYWIKRDVLFTEKTLLTSKCGYIKLSEREVQDIDTMDDWKYAELKYKLINERK